MGGGGEKTSRGDPGRRRKQMRRGRKLGRQQQGRQSIVVKGNDCEFIYLADITSNSGCSNGQKFVLKGANNTRKQFLIVNDKAIIAFITKRKKFTACESFTDITTSVSCKTVSGLDNVTLPTSSSSSSNSSSNSTDTGTTSAAAATTVAAAAASGTTAASNSSASTCQCGLEGTRRIVGGEESTSGKYPWIAALNFDTTDGLNPGGCGATLVASQWIVTAAHCVKDGSTLSTKDDLSVVLGEFDLSSANDEFDTNRKNVRLAMDPIIHEDYQKDFQYNNDIALLKLAEEVDTAIYTPACLAAVDADYTGQNGRVYGWGSTASCPATTQATLLEVELQIISDTECSAQTSDSVTFTDQSTGQCVTESSSYDGRISEQMLCAGATGKDSCQGDSGGPFTVKNSGTNKHDLVGVVSWGDGCAADGMSGVYAEVAKLRTWIDTKIAENGGGAFCN